MAAVLCTCESKGLQDVHVVENAKFSCPSEKVTQGCDKWLDTAVRFQRRAGAQGGWVSLWPPLASESLTDFL
jgi:hypothetical protein